ncbi:MAG: hypothetical protein ACYTAS_09155 [Planctomycetota bacterium]
MSRTSAGIGFVACAVALLWGSVPCRAEGSPLATAAERAVGRLVRAQADDGPFVGAWPGEEVHTGSIIAGLASAFELVCDENAKAAAIAGGEYVMIAAAGNYYGDEAYALSCLSRISADREENPWRRAVGDFYRAVETVAAGGTQGYVSQFGQAELSQAIFYLAHHAVAAFYVGADDAALWRQGLVDFLVQVNDDSADLPIMALGAATWALATTGALDDSPLDPCDIGASYWQGRTFAELPGLLLSHQVGEGELAGSFHWRLDHGNAGTGAPAAGYVEETVFGAIGLAAANRTLKDSEIDDRILLARDLLSASINDDGAVTQHLSLGGGAPYFYAGEVLRALAELTRVGNLDLRSVVNGGDFALWAGHWREGDCADCCGCGRADLDRNGRVGAGDLAVLANNWLDP